MILHLFRDSVSIWLIACAELETHWTFMLKSDWCLSSFPSITQEELETDFEKVLQRIDLLQGPFLVRSAEGNSLILLSWEDYWEHFETLYPDGEREHIEKLCSNIHE